jgi:chemotaxis protein methyltransferase CheR
MSISQELLGRTSGFVADRMCLHFPRERWPDLERGICAAAVEFGFKDVESCIRWLLSEPFARNQSEILASYLTVGETYFFRERKVFTFLEESILPELIRAKRETGRRLRIWSAGCATGEEPYSIAILLSRLIPDMPDWQITILGTDINPNFLKKALAGVYSEWSFRDNPDWVRDNYFRKIKSGHFELLPAVKNMVTFSYHNLAEDAYPLLCSNTNAMDIIFCRNVLMYFLPDAGTRAIGNFCRCLTDNGWLIIGLSETPHVSSSQFTRVSFPDITLYRKGGESGRTLPLESLPGKLAEEPVILSLSSPVFAVEPETIPFRKAPDYPAAQPGEPLLETEREETVENPEGGYQTALDLYQQGRYTEVVDRILEPAGLDRTNPRTLVLLARAYANQGRLEEARGWCEKAIMLDKLNPGIHYFRAIILQEQGLIDEAVKTLKQVLYLNHNFALAYFALGNLARQQNKFKESGKYLDNTLILLKDFRPEEVLPESEGMTAGRLAEIVRITAGKQDVPDAGVSPRAKPFRRG